MEDFVGIWLPNKSHSKQCSILLSRLRSLSTWTYTGTGAFRLEALLSKCPALRNVDVEIEVQSLSDQIQWGFGHKLRRIHLRGTNWTALAADALLGLEGVEEVNKKVSFDLVIILVMQSLAWNILTRLEL